MIKTFFCCLALLGLYIADSPALAAEKGASSEISSVAGSQSHTTVSVELHDLITRIQSKLNRGKNTAADLEPELKGFDALLKKYAGEKTDDVAEILATEAKLYLQVLNDSAKSRQLVMRLKQEFPLTTQGRKADETLNSITQHEQAARIRSFLVTGNQFPDFAEKDTARHQLALSAHRGKVVLLHFWASWSKTSVAELAAMIAIYEEYHERGFDIIGVSLDEDQMMLSSFTTRNKMRWPQFCDSARWNNKLAVKYGVNVLPTSYLLDREGKIISRNLSGQTLRERVAAALVEK